MEIRNQKNKKKIIIAVVAIIVIIVAAAVGVFAYRHHQEQQASKAETSQTKDDNDQDQDKDDESDQDTQGDGSTTDDSSDNQANADSDPTNGGKTPVRYEGGNVQDSETLTGAINGISIAGDNLSIRVTINQYITDPDGRCELTLTSPSGATYNYWSELIQNPQSTSCYGWDIPLSDFGGSVSGHWTAKVVVNGDGRTGTLTSEVDL